MIESLTFEEQEIVRVTRKFIDEYLVPVIPEIERTDDAPPAMLEPIRAKAVELGIYGYNLPPELGGLGLSYKTQAAIGMELGRVSGILRRGLFLPETLKFAREEQYSWFRDPIIAGKLTVQNALTEPNAGSDLGALQTRAEKQGSEWVINGEKQFISYFDQSDFFVMLTVTDPKAKLKDRFTAFIVDPKRKGFELTPRLKLLGWRGTHLGGFRFTDYRLPESHILGEPNKGFDVLTTSINGARLNLGSVCAGLSAHILDACGEHVVNRKTFGKRLGEHQAVLFMLADRDIEVDLGRRAVEYASEVGDAWRDGKATDEQFRITASKAKLYGSELVGRVADTAVQLFGAAGVTADLPVEKWYRDARLFRLGEGASEIQRVQIGRSFLERYSKGR